MIRFNAIPEKTLFTNEAFQLSSHRLRQGNDCAELIDGKGLCITRGEGEKRKQRCIPIPAIPADQVGYHGDIPVLNAMYALALHELKQDINDEGMLKAGALWPGVWTRDIAYACILGADLSQAQACRKSLESRVENGYILQDTGTGGGWPVSTDRVAWSLAAWHYYLITNDQQWLEWAAAIILTTHKQDELILHKQGELIAGESSFLDWREQSYPDWMSPADIGGSFAFSTNILHASSRQILSKMLIALGRKEEAREWEDAAKRHKQEIREKFWHRGSQQFGMHINIDNYLDERPDALANALAVLTGIAGEHGITAMQNLPRSPYGTPVFSPCKCSQKDSYHNRSIWPFAESFVLLAHAEMQDLHGCAHSMAYILRAAMLFGSNKENLNAMTGEADDTVLNSDRQLWSVAGMLGMYYYGIFGIRIEKDQLFFSPCIPKSYEGSHWLTNLRIRDLTLDIHITGYGTDICSVRINGKMNSSLISLKGKGRMHIEIELQPQDDSDEDGNSDGGFNSAENLCLLSRPYPAASEDLNEALWDAPTPTLLRWKAVEGATSYRIFRRGKALAQTAQLESRIDAPLHSARYRIQAINANTKSCLGAPYQCYHSEARHILQPERIGAKGEYQIENNQAWLDSKECTRELHYSDITLPAGLYALRFHYCNASASLRDSDTCALRKLSDNDKHLCYIAFPHNTEQGQWKDNSLTAPFLIELEEGEHHFKLSFSPDCLTSGSSINQCILRSLEITRMQP